jgi:hypothetical protein
MGAGPGMSRLRPCRNKRCNPDMTPGNALQRTGGHRGRPMLALNGVLAGLERALRPAIVAATALGLASCATVDQQTQSANRLFERVTGTWGSMIEGKLSCDTWAETITFSTDRSTATFNATRKYIVAGGKRTNTITYKVLAVRDNAITMSMNEEDRRTKRGDLVVWTLILLDDDEFVWHRTDWPAGETTSPRLRCKGERK